MPSDANQVRLYYVAETTFNETPDGSKQLQELGFTAADLKVGPVYQDSEEVRSDRQLANLPKVGEDASGRFDAELSMRALNDFFAACLGTTWSTVSPGAITCAITAGGTQTIVAASGLSVFANARYIKVAGAANSGNNGIKKIVSVTDTTITLAASSLTTNEASPSLTLTAKYARVGQTLTSFMVEQRFVAMDNGSDRFKRLSGVGVNEISLDIAAKSRVKATVSMMAASGAYAATTSGDGSPLAKTALPLITTNANVATIYRGGVAIVVPVQSLPLTIKNNLRPRPALATQNTLEFGLNEFDVTGTINAYFTKKDLVDEVIAGTSSALEFALNDAGGKVLSFYLPLVKLTAGEPNPSNKNSDVMTALTFRGLGSDSAKAFQIDYLEP